MKNLRDFGRAQTGISICFIVVILIVNSIFIFKAIRQRKGKFIYNPKSLILISLAIGDIILAAFSLVIIVIVWSDYSWNYYYGMSHSGPWYSMYGRWIEPGPHCLTRLSAEVYQKFLLNFVYGVGLVVFAVDIILRQNSLSRDKIMTGSFVRAIIFSALPWLFGLVVILPLTMAGVDFKQCWTHAGILRNVAQHLISISLPVVAAIASTTVTYMRKHTVNAGIVPSKPPQNVNGETVLYTPARNNVSDSLNVSQSAVTLGISGHQEYSQLETGPVSAVNQTQSGNDPTHSGLSHNTLPRSTVTVHTSSRQGSFTNSASLVSASQPDPDVTLAVIELHEDMKCLLKVTATYSLLVYPSSFLLVSYYFSSSEEERLVFEGAFIWLRVLRSVITPFLWISWFRACNKNRS